MVAIGAAALVDAIRPGRGAAPPAAPTTVPAETARPELPAALPFTTDLSRHTAALHGADAVGLLVVADPDCRIELVPLPELERVRLDLCARRLVEAGGTVTLAGAAARRSGPRALRPDGALTIVRGGALREIRVGDRDSRLLLSREDLERLPLGGATELVGIAWATNRRLFAILRRPRAPRYAFAVLEDGRLVGSECCFASLGGLRASPRGTYADVRSEHGVLVYRRDGVRVPLAPSSAPPADAVAWSPDERLAAVARGGAVDVLALDGRTRTAVVARLPVDAADLRWVQSEDHLVLPG